MTELVVFVASPGDVASERDRLERVVREVNEWARRTGCSLRLVRWEKDVRPGVGEDPQAVVNRQVGEADITVVLFWKRLGTPTERAASGTVEEFDRAVERWRQDPKQEIFTYFKTAPIDIHKDDLGQAQGVRDFRRRIAAITLDCEFRTGADFEQKVRSHLTSAVLDRIRHGVAATAPSPEAPEYDAVDAYLLGLRARDEGRPQEAIEWLRRAADEGHAQAVFDLGITLREQGRADEADECFRRAAEGGNVAAVYTVGLRLKEHGQRKEAEEWLRRAAEEGDVAAMYNLGLVLRERGEDDRAELWLRLGAEGGDVAAMYNLGLLLRDRDDEEGAELWLRRGAQGGDVAAMRDLGLLLREDGPSEGSELWLRRAAKRGDTGAMNALAIRDES
jgi:TPR repeat protein